MKAVFFCDTVHPVVKWLHVKKRSRKVQLNNINNILALVWMEFLTITCPKIPRLYNISLFECLHNSFREYSEPVDFSSFIYKALNYYLNPLYQCVVVAVPIAKQNDSRALVIKHSELEAESGQNCSVYFNKEYTTYSSIDFAAR